MSADRQTEAPLPCRSASVMLAESSSARWALRSFVGPFGMRGTVTDAWEPATSTQDYRGLGRVGTAAGYSPECAEGEFSEVHMQNLRYPRLGGLGGRE